MERPTTLDSLAGGRLELEQSRSGFRFGLDSVILATDIPRLPASGGRVVDLGAGHGAVSCLVALQTSASLVALEREPSLFELLRANVARNHLEDRIKCVQGDLREPSTFLEAHSADLVLANPPFYRAGEGRESPDAQRRSAHHELNGGLEDFVKAAAFVAKPAGGRLKIILPPKRLDDLTRAIALTDMALESLRFVHSKPDEAAYLFEAVARRQSRAELTIRAPLFIHESDAAYSVEMSRRLDP